MRWRPSIWLSLGLLVLAVWWYLRGRIGSSEASQPSPSPVTVISAGLPSTGSQPSIPEPVSSRLTHRLSNTSLTVGQLARREHAILLENAVLDTELPLVLDIPERLLSQQDPGSYIVQARGHLDNGFRVLLMQVRAKLISYIPNNACLIRASPTAAQMLTRDPRVQAVLPYEPYFKLKSTLLTLALDQDQAAEPTVSERAGDLAALASAHSLALNVLVFADARDATLNQLQNLKAKLLAEDSSPFGVVLRMRLDRNHLAQVACLPGVQEIELAHPRVPANDLSRAVLGVATNAVTPFNYLDLTGTNVLVNVNDTGVDATHPDLSDRVLFDSAAAGSDTNGHGTHVAGIIAGSGLSSTNVTYAPGSSVPAAEFQFRGMAPAAKIFSICADLSSGPAAGDSSLQQQAAETNAFISNNSWLYAGQNEYDLSAASYDAAVRDALPGAGGPQPLLCVFPAGNSGAGSADGSGGDPDTIFSPATAKNVITVGAIEKLRLVTNETWTCTGEPDDCQTNTPWLGMTDSSNQVAAFSSRGNVGVGLEGDFGRFKPDVVAPGTFVISTRSTQWDQVAYYSQTNNWYTEIPDTNYSEVLSNLNDPLGPSYRFESGTSLAAADVSGTLVLMQEFFEQRLGLNPSPALMKALLINGARSLGGGLRLGSTTNLQGWGLINLPNSLPGSLSNLTASANCIFAWDQDPSDALATGQSYTRFLSVNPAARESPLRLTLVWTDPPGNPAAGIKLVNDLDLVVTNLTTGAVFHGNHIDGEFSTAWDPNAPPDFDVVNNVENVFLASPLDANYSVTVFARRVNVNAVTARAEGILQDYALVATGGDGQIPDALELVEPPVGSVLAPSPIIITNSFALATADAGGFVCGQRVGANPPSLGTGTIPWPGGADGLISIGLTDQWNFYIFTNETEFTNAAFFTFLARPVATSDLGTTTNPGGAGSDADIDLYVSRDPALLRLDPEALAGADKSLSRGGSEVIVYSNATPGIYYLGVKSERQEGADYSLGVDVSEQPFAETDLQGNVLMRGFPAPAAISSNAAAGVFCLAPDPVLVHRVIVTNALTHPAMSDLVGMLSHGSGSVILNNHSTNGAVTAQSFIYEDSLERDVPGAQPSDGPGSLLDFAAKDGAGLWRLDMTSTNDSGTNDSLWISLESQPDPSGFLTVALEPGACRTDYISVPPSGTNLSAMLSLVSGSGPVFFTMSPIGVSPTNYPTVTVSASCYNTNLTLDKATHPLLNPGIYSLRLCNSGADPAAISLMASVGTDLAPVLPVVFKGAGGPIPDDAVSSFSLPVNSSGCVLSAEVGVRIDHPRVSDLVLHLVSPSGTRVLLAENRGGLSTNGMGLDMLVTNITPVFSTGGPEAATNVLDTGQTSGTISIDYDFYSVPDDLRVYYETNLIFDSGQVSDTGTFIVDFGPGQSTFLTIVMNEGGNNDSNTAWAYTVTSTRLQPLCLTFSENTNPPAVPIKFAPIPLTNINYSISDPTPSFGIYYLPEESLAKLSGEPAGGIWRLDIEDTRAGPTGASVALNEWQLALEFQDDLPVSVLLPPGAPWTNVLGPGQLQWFAVDVPSWVSFATNFLLDASAPVNLWFNPAEPPTGTNAGDLNLLLNSTTGVVVLQTNGAPPLTPGARYFLGVQNTNSGTVSFALETDFDLRNVLTLDDGIPWYAGNEGSNAPPDYYRFVVSTNAVRVQFEINGPTANVTLLARRGPPPPSADSFDFISANPNTNEELIVVYDFSRPVPLAPGEWFLTVLNDSGAPVNYSILATESEAYGTNVLITSQSMDPADFCLTWTSLPGAHYFVRGTADLGTTNWTTLSPTLTATDFFTTFCIPLPSPFNFFSVQEGIVVIPDPIVISSIVHSNNAIWLQWTAPKEDRFTVEWTPSLESPSWVSFTNVITSTDGTFTFQDEGTQSGPPGQTRFYRLSQLP